MIDDALMDRILHGYDELACFMREALLPILQELARQCTSIVPAHDRHIMRKKINRMVRR